MATTRELRTVHIDFGEIGEPGYWAKLVDPRWLSQNGMRRLLGRDLPAGADGAVTVPTEADARVMLRAFVAGWNLVDFDSDQDPPPALPLPKDAPRDAAGAVLPDQDPLNCVPGALLAYIASKIVEVQSAPLSATPSPTS